MTDWIEKDNLPPAPPKEKKKKRRKERQLSLPLEGFIAAKSAQERDLKSSEVHHERVQA